MINIKLPYENASEYYRFWANDEESIDFRNDLFSATRCTVSFAASELALYLEKMGFEAKVSETEGEFTIHLLCDEKEDEQFEISGDNSSVTIKGMGRAGVLYGVYEFLEAQGIRWYSPKEEYVPKNKELIMPAFKKYIYDMPVGRGFEFEGPLKESASLYLWMARNRLNISGLRSNTIALQRKLCMKLKVGGHIFEKILAPDNFTENGKLFLDAHKQWYGKRTEPITIDNALKVQFCVSETDLLDYLADKLMEKVKNEWKEADVVDVWPFDTWGGSCECEECKKLGNGTDRILKFLSHLRTRTNNEIENKTLDHNFRWSTDLYEGTDTIEPPLNPVPQNLLDAGDYVQLAPILRCYKHKISDKCCDVNEFYATQMENVKDIKLCITEYYNVSKFEDLPLIFTDTLIDDIKYYHKINVQGLNYMHVPLAEWGVRTITQYILANITRDRNVDTDKIIKEYFSNLYGEYAPEAINAYKLCEKATEYVSSWRSWSEYSVLSTLISWNGYNTDVPLYRDDHLGENAAEKGLEAAKMFEEAENIMKDIRKKVHESLCFDVPDVVAVGVNPSQMQKFKTVIPILDRLNEDIRGLKYGADCFELISLFVEYYELLYNKQDETEVWNRIYELANEMSGYTFSYNYVCPQVEITCNDALERSGLKELFARVICARNKRKINN